MTMVEQSIASFNKYSLPDIEAGPLPVSGVDLVFLRIAEEAATCCSGSLTISR